MFDAYFIQYKFMIPNTMKHSSYTYQKIFRALYGYTQSVAKSNGKTYTYHRHGVLSEVPYIRPGKNCVVIPKETLSRLIEFFKTGKNPAHHWECKGDWKAVYYMDEKNLDEGLVTRSLEHLIERTFVPAIAGGHARLETKLAALLEKNKNNEEVSKAEKEALLGTTQHIITLPWFKQSYSKSDKLRRFSEQAQKLRNL